MKSIKDETDQLYAIISKFENATKEAESISKEVSSVLFCSSVFISPPSASQSPWPKTCQADCGIRDYGKKVHAFEMELETTIDKLNKATEEFEEKDAQHMEVDIVALS